MMSSFLSRFIRRWRGLPPVAVHPSIVAAENMFVADSADAYLDWAAIFMAGPMHDLPRPDVPLADTLDEEIILGWDEDALAHLDSYLLKVHLKCADKTDDESLRQLRNLIAYAGSYVGQCFIENIAGCRWLLPHEIMERDKDGVLAAGGDVDAQLTGAIYHDETDVMVFPFAKIVKFLMNGAEDKTLAFFRVFAEQMGGTDFERLVTEDG